MEIQCHWQTNGGNSCPHTSRNLIIYGCPNQHVAELAVCITHHNTWQLEFKNYWLYCNHCDQMVIEWDSVPVNKLTLNYHLTRNQ